MKIPPIPGPMVFPTLSLDLEEANQWEFPPTKTGGIDDFGGFGIGIQWVFL